ncbi:methyltransferase [Nonomuraea sp. NN258]|nr:methyltransferase [Nonomuraea antri]
MLAPAYLEHTRGPLSAVRFELVTRAILENLPDRPCDIVDVGGGHARQAIMLARAGHQVTVADPDPVMLAAARRNLADEPAEVRERVRLVPGRVDGGAFDAVCCHSVLAYLDDPAPMLGHLVALAGPGGLLSVLALNADAIAMRSGLRGDWRDGLASLRAGRQVGDAYLPARADRVEDLAERLAGLGAPASTWYGVRIFTDHRDDSGPIDGLADLLELEWEAGARDPYRRVARLFHLLAVKQA